MPQPQTLLRPDRPAVELDTGRRTVERLVDGAGHLRTRLSATDLGVARAAAGDSAIGFRGHAALFNKRAWIGGKRYGFWEQLAPSAFSKTIQEADVRFLMNHDPQYVLARNRSGTLRLSEDNIGLAVDADMAPTTYAQDLAVVLERGDVSQMSFAFDMVTYEWSEADDGTEMLTHREVKLYDVAVVTYPAYEETDAGLRSAGFDRLAARLGLDADTRRRVLAAETDEEIDEALATVRAASDEGRPAEPTASEGPPAETTGNRHGLERRLRAARLRLLADQHGLDLPQGV